MSVLAIAALLVSLEHDSTRLLDGHARVRLSEAMIVRDDDTAVLDWGDTRFTVVAAIEPIADVRADVVVGAPALFSSSVTATATTATETVPDGTLVYTARRAAPDGTVCVLRFYVSMGSDPRPWRPVARAIAASLDVRPSPSPPSARIVVRTAVAAPVVLPRGWTVSTSAHTQHLASPHGSCDIEDNALDVHSQAPGATSYVAGALRGTDVYWSVWRDGAVMRDETRVGARTLGYVNVECRAATARELEQQRALVERLWRE